MINEKGINGTAKDINNWKVTGSDSRDMPRNEIRKDKQKEFLKDCNDLIDKKKEEIFENMKIVYQCGHCGCVYDTFIECQNCNTDDFIEKSFQCNFCNKIFSSSNHNCDKKETFESYLESHSFEITSNVRVHLKQLHNESIKERNNFSKKESDGYEKQLLNFEIKLYEKDKEIEKYRNLCNNQQVDILSKDKRIKELESWDIKDKLNERIQELQAFKIKSENLEEELQKQYNLISELQADIKKLKK